MTQGPRHRKQSWVMLACIVALAMLLIVLGFYAVGRQGNPQPGSAGSLILQSGAPADQPPAR